MIKITRRHRNTDRDIIIIIRYYYCTVYMIAKRVTTREREMTRVTIILTNYVVLI